MALFDEFYDYPNERLDFTNGDGFQDTFEKDEQLVAGAGVVATTVEVTKEVPLVELQKCETSLSAAVRSTAVSSDVIVLALENGTVVRMDLASPDERVVIKFGQYGTAIHRVFLDPTANFLLVSLESGENFYVHTRWKSPKPKPLSKTKVIIESVAWDLAVEEASSTRDILLGSRDGIIFETILEEKGKVPYFRAVLDLQHSMPIVGLHFEWSSEADLQLSKDGEKSSTCSIVAASASRFYDFVGTRTPGSGFESVFAPYGNNLKHKEVLGAGSSSELRVWRKHPAADPIFAWVTAKGIYSGTIIVDDDEIAMQQDKTAVMDEKLMPYPEHEGPFKRPLALDISEFHFLMLFPELLVAVSVLSGDTVFSKPLTVGSVGSVRGFSVDPVAGTRWMYTDGAIFELVLVKEDRDVWKMYMELGNYRQALKHCKDDEQRETVKCKQAENAFALRSFEKSARFFAATHQSFERVVMLFVKARQYSAVQTFLLERLKTTGSQDAMQRTAIVTWLLEQYLHEITRLEAQGNNAPALQLVTVLRQFLIDHKEELDRATTYSLINAYGRVEDGLHYSMIVEDYDRVLNHFLQQGKYTEALEVMTAQASPEIIYRFSPILMQHAPADTVSAWIKNRHIEPRRLLPALVRYDPSSSLSGDSDHQDIRYLRHCVRKLGNKDEAIHNMIIGLYARRREDEHLLRFIMRQGSRPLFDFNYALRTCMQHRRHRACVELYGNMGLFAEAVDMALSFDLDLAKEYADRPEEDEELRHRLWLKIAKHIVENDDLSKAISIIKESKLLKIEDILPYVPDGALIEDFKDEICDSLEHYNQRIDELVQEMAEATHSAELIRKDIKRLRNRNATVMEHQRCDLCRVLVLGRSFFVFPCQHAFHTDCLFYETLRYASKAAKMRLMKLQDGISQLSRARSDMGVASKSESTLEQLTTELNDQIANQCPLCGEIMIKTIDLPFLTPEEVTSADWAVTVADVSAFQIDSMFADDDLILDNTDGDEYS